MTDMPPRQRAGLLRGRLDSKRERIRRLQRELAQLQLDVLNLEDEITQLKAAS